MRAVLLDIDGTLVDSNEQHVAAWRTVFAQAGHPRPAGAIRMQIGKGGDLLVPTLVPGLSERAQRHVAERHGVVFKQRYLARIRPFPGAATLVRVLRQRGHAVVLASSASRAELQHYIGLLGIGHCLAATVSIDDVAASKPAPDIFGAAIAKIRVAPADAVAVGDTPYDVAAARRAGVGTIGLTSGPFDAARLRTAGAVALFAGVADLLTRLDRSPLGK